MKTFLRILAGAVSWSIWSTIFMVTFPETGLADGRFWVVTIATLFLTIALFLIDKSEESD